MGGSVCMCVFLGEGGNKRQTTSKKKRVIVRCGDNEQHITFFSFFVLFVLQLVKI